MTNEELLEEFYWKAHHFGVFENFRKDVSLKLKKSTDVENITVVESVYNDYIKNGLISEASHNID
jgi:hypothetical protein